MRTGARWTRRLLALGLLLTMAGASASSLAGRVAAQEPVTLTVWDSWVRDVENEVIETLNAEFEAANPGVTIERTSKSFDDMKATAKLALSSADGPDLAQVNQGLSDMGAMVQAGILADLTPYAEEYGWLDILSPSLAARQSFSEDGEVFGEGNLYGMPLTAEFVGVYYNKAKLEAAGLSLPTTLAEFESALQTLKDAGEIPIQFGNLEAWPAIHTYGQIQHEYVTRQYLDDFIYGRNNVSFVTPENEEAAAKLQEWVDAGYFTPDFAGIGYDDSWQAFKSGEGAFMITGSWISGELAVAEDQAFGFFLFPPLEEGQVNMQVAGTSLAYAIREDSPNRDLAAKYVDFLLSDRAVEAWMEAQVVPLGVKSDQVEAGTLYGDLVAGWNRIQTTNSAGHYLDWATPTFYDTLTAALTELMGGAIDPATFVQTLEEDYAAYLAEKGS